VSNPEGPAQPQWCFDIPIRFKDTMASLSLTICRDNEPKGQSSDQQDWKATLSTTLPKLGLVEAELFLRGEKVSVVIFSEQTKIANLINDQIDQLRTGLESRGLDVSVLISREGELSSKQNRDNVSGCVDERI
jgi:flagellar hook-length control protein FliK